MTSMVRTQGQKGGYFFVPLTADSLHSVANLKWKRKIKSERMGEVDETIFCIIRESILYMHLRLHETVEVDNSGTFDTCLTDEASS